MSAMDIKSLLKRIGLLEAENQRLMANQGQVILETNRKLQLHQHQERQLTQENKELRDLCCFLDDQRQKVRKLSKEWQNFARYTASVLKDDVAAYQEKLKLLEENYKSLVTENQQLRERCETIKRSKSFCQSCHRPVSRESARFHRLSVPNFISDDCEILSTESTESSGIYYDGVTGSNPSLTGRNLLLPRISDAVQLRQPSGRKTPSPPDSIGETRLDSGMSSGDSGEIEPSGDKPTMKGQLQLLLKSLGNSFDHTRSESHLDEVVLSTHAPVAPPVANSTPNMIEVDTESANEKLLEKIRQLEDRVIELEKTKINSTPSLDNLIETRVEQPVVADSQPLQQQSDLTSSSPSVITEEDWVSFTSSLATIEEADEDEVATIPESTRRRYISKSEPNLRGTNKELRLAKLFKSPRYNSFAMFGRCEDFDVDSVWDNFLLEGDDSLTEAFKLLEIEEQTAKDSMSDAQKSLIEQMCHVAWKTLEMTPSQSGLVRSSSVNLKLITSV